MLSPQKIFQNYQRLQNVGVRAYRWPQLPKPLQRQLSPGGRPALTIMVPAGALEIIFDSRRLAAERLAFIIAKGADVTIIEQGAGERLVLTEPGSQVSYLINAKDGLPANFNYTAELGPESHLTWYFWARNRADSSGSIAINQSAKNYGRIIGGLTSDGQSHLTLRLVNHHRQEHSAGNIDFKAVGRGEARIVINGLIKIDPDAKFTDSHLTQAGLLLSPESEIQTMPNLEILNHEVKAAHSASVGRLDPNALHYLTSRGLTSAQAKRLLVKGFFARLLTHIENPIIKKRFAQLIN